MSDITPRVSVIVATYNRGNGLRENIDSVLDQDFDAYEAIYVDDGSTDETPTILREYTSVTNATYANPDQVAT